MHIRNELFRVYERLETTPSLDQGWPGGEWPVSGDFEPVEFEIVIGAILTQNTNWKNAERGLVRLRDIGLIDAERIVGCRSAILEDAIRPVGFFRQKSAVLKRLAGTILEFGQSFYSRVLREDLLSVKGIGPETADAILLFACGRTEFVADAYGRRIFHRYGLLEDVSYQEAKDFVEAHLPAEVRLYRRFHALLVEHAKKHCRTVPVCHECVLQNDCRAAKPS